MGGGSEEWGAEVCKWVDRPGNTGMSTCRCMPLERERDKRRAVEGWEYVLGLNRVDGEGQVVGLRAGGMWVVLRRGGSGWC